MGRHRWPIRSLPSRAARAEGHPVEAGRYSVRSVRGRRRGHRTTGWGHVPKLESYLTMGSLQIFKSLQPDLGHYIAFRASGAIRAVQTAEQYEYARDRVASLKSRTYSVEFLTVNESRESGPELSPHLEGAVHFPLRAQCDPVKHIQASADVAVHCRIPRIV